MFSIYLTKIKVNKPTDNPFFFDIRVSGLEGVGLFAVGAAGAAAAVSATAAHRVVPDGHAEAAGVHVAHLLVLLPDGRLDVGQDAGGDGSVEAVVVGAEGTE